MVRLECKIAVYFIGVTAVSFKAPSHRDTDVFLFLSLSLFLF